MLEKRSRRKSEHYAAVYDAIIKHIDNFSLEFDCDIFTNSVTAEFLDDFTVDVTYDEIDLKCEPTNAVFLSMNEITRIYYYKFVGQDKRKAKERMRDMFVLGCLTALRYSDYSRLTSQNFINNYIMIRTKKTNVDVKVPAHD